MLHLLGVSVEVMPSDRNPDKKVRVLDVVDVAAGREETGEERRGERGEGREERGVSPGEGRNKLKGEGGERICQFEVRGRIGLILSLHLVPPTPLEFCQPSPPPPPFVHASTHTFHECCPDERHSVPSTVA